MKQGLNQSRDCHLACCVKSRYKRSTLVSFPRVSGIDPVSLFEYSGLSKILCTS